MIIFFYNGTMPVGNVSMNSKAAVVGVGGGGISSHMMEV